MAIDINDPEVIRKVKIQDNLSDFEKMILDVISREYDEEVYDLAEAYDLLKQKYTNHVVLKPVMKDPTYFDVLIHIVKAYHKRSCIPLVDHVRIIT